jgi:energy-coupling factor transporter ATP-binding protein EcfA2
LLDRYDRVIADAATHLPVESVEPAATIGQAVRRRRALVGKVTVVGLLGGTGAGKSSLLNALAGDEVSAAGAMRPTTARPLAWIPSDADPALDALLDMLGIHERVHHGDIAPLAILDLPDIDSLVTDHRRLVFDVLPYLDVALWVLDPEKYHDRTLHDLVRSLLNHQSTFRFVLNQIDRLDPADQVLVTADLQRALRADGVSNPVVWTAAADPSFGPPLDIEEILESLLAAPTLSEERDREMVNELERGAGMLAVHLQSVDFTGRWESVLKQAGGFIRDSRQWEAEMELMVFASEVLPGVPLDVSGALAAAADQPDPGAALDASVGRQMRERLHPRARTRALLADLQLALREALPAGP